MKKDAYYFPHYSNARNDPKIIKLRRIFGGEGYGLFFMLLEVLREQTKFQLSISSIEDLAFEFHTSKEKLLSIVNDFELFEIIDNQFFSSKLIFYLQPYLEKSERARQAANKRWKNAKALPEHCNRNASKVKETKVKDTSQFPFKNFWDLYSKKVDRKNCYARYQKISENDREKIVKHLPLYIKYTPDPKYRKNPLTYLNGECWNDEFVIEKTSQKKAANFYE